METSCSSITSSVSSVGGSIKLAINKNEKLRRIAISRLLKDKNDYESISFDSLKKYAISYSGLTSDNVEMKATYLDEDGDCIEISTDEELADAIMFQDELSKSSSKVSSLLTVHVDIVVEENEKGLQTEKSSDVEKLESASQTDDSETEKVSTSEVEEKAAETAEKATEATDGKTEENESEQPATRRYIRRPQRQRRHCRNRRYKHQKNVPPPVKAAVDTVLNFVNDTVDTITAGLSPYPASTHYTQTVFDPNFVHSRHTCDGCGSSPIIGYRYHATNIPDFDLCLPCKNECVLPDINFIQTQDGAITNVSPEYEGFDPNFVHSRHTCDGCGISPVVGYRWHSTNIANYDLCDDCKSKTMCADITFKLQQIEADRAYPRSNPVPPANNPDAISEEKLASDLQKALQLSFEESKANEQKTADNNDEAAQPADQPLVLSASEAFEFLVPTVRLSEEHMIKSTPQILETDNVSETGTQTDMALLSTEDKSQQTDLNDDKIVTEDNIVTEENIVTEDEKDTTDEKDVEDSFTSIEKDDSKFISDVDKDEKEKDEGDDEWAMVEDETDFVAIGSSLFQQGLNSS